MVNQSQSTQSNTPSHGEEATIDLVAEARATREKLRRLIDLEHLQMMKSIAERITRHYSRFRFIRQPIEKLQFLAESRMLMHSRELAESNGVGDARAAYLHNAVAHLEQQLQGLKRCARSKGQVACGALGCPACSSSRRDQAIAEAAAYLQRVAAYRGFKRFFSFTIVTDAWALPLHEADGFLRSEMVHGIRMLTKNLKCCSDILMSIEGSFVPDVSSDQPTLQPSDRPISDMLDQTVLWHLHGVLVCREKHLAKLHLLESEIKEALHFHLPLQSDAEIHLKPLRVTQSPVNPDKPESAMKWLAYITKQLTSDRLTASERRAMRACTHHAYNAGILSTGPILYWCDELKSILGCEEYYTRLTERRLEWLENADVEQLRNSLERVSANYKKEGWHNPVSDN